jgi:hypothetical protein
MFSLAFCAFPFERGTTVALACTKQAHSLSTHAHVIYLYVSRVVQHNDKNPLLLVRCDTDAMMCYGSL